MIKLSCVATNMMGVSGRSMIDALIDRESDPPGPGREAKGRLRVQRGALLEAMNGRFDAHLSELAKTLLTLIDGLSAQIDFLGDRIEAIIAVILAAQPPPQTVGSDGVIQTEGLGAVDRIDEITRIGRHAAQTIIAEVGLNMAIFPTAAHLASWANLSPRAIQSGTKNRRDCR